MGYDEQQQLAPAEEVEEDELTPEELVLEAAASSAYDPDAQQYNNDDQKTKKHNKGMKRSTSSSLSENNSRDEAENEDDDDDDSNKLLASIPTQLERGGYLQRSLPGAYREGTATGRDEQNNGVPWEDDDDTTADASSSCTSRGSEQQNQGSLVGSGGEGPLVEATLVVAAEASTTTTTASVPPGAAVALDAALVEEGQDHHAHPTPPLTPQSPSSHHHGHAADATREVVKAEPMPPSSTNKRQWSFWIGLLIGTIVSIATVVLVFVLSDDSGSGDNDQLQPTPAPTPDFLQEFDRFDRITDHVVFLGLWVQENSCDIKRQGGNALAQVKLTCGDKRVDNNNGNTPISTRATKPIIALRPGQTANCRRRGDDEFRCDLQNFHETIFFTCGTMASDYPQEGRPDGSDTTTTASASIEEVEAICTTSDESGGGGRLLRRRTEKGANDGSVSAAPRPAVFSTIAMGRLCRPGGAGSFLEEENGGGGGFFQSVGEHCEDSDTGNLLLANNRNVDFCYKKRDDSCKGLSCLVRLSQFTAFDPITSDRCDSSSVDESILLGVPAEQQQQVVAPEVVFNSEMQRLDEELRTHTQDLLTELHQELEEDGKEEDGAPRAEGIDEDPDG